MGHRFGIVYRARTSYAPARWPLPSWSFRTGSGLGRASARPSVCSVDRHPRRSGSVASPTATLVVEPTLIAALASTRAPHARATGSALGVLGFVAFLVVAYASSIAGGAPPSPQVWQRRRSSGGPCVVIAWFDRHRDRPASPSRRRANPQTRSDTEHHVGQHKRSTPAWPTPVLPRQPRTARSARRTRTPTGVFDRCNGSSNRAIALLFPFPSPPRLWRGADSRAPPVRPARYRVRQPAKADRRRVFVRIVDLFGRVRYSDFPRSSPIPCSTGRPKSDSTDARLDQFDAFDLTCACSPSEGGSSWLSFGGSRSRRSDREHRLGPQTATVT